MGRYRSSPTCSYCRRSHSILDCEKLVKNGQESEKILADWKPEYDVMAHASQMQWTFKKQPDGSRVWDRSANNWYERRREEYGVALSYTAEEWELIKQSKPKNEHQNIKNHYVQVQAKKASRAKKACSYCRGPGHTVRKCPKIIEDGKLMDDFRILDSYYKAKVLSRHGLWTAAMVLCDGECYIVRGKEDAQGVMAFSFLPDRSITLSTQGCEMVDACDKRIEQAYLHSCLDCINFVNVKHNPTDYYHNSLSSYKRNYDVLTDSVWVDEASGHPGKFLPSAVDVSYIFKALYKGNTRRDIRKEEIKVITRRRQDDDGNILSTSCWSISMTENKNKRRNHDYYNMIQEYLENHKESLNIGKDMLVSIGYAGEMPHVS